MAGDRRFTVHGDVTFTFDWTIPAEYDAVYGLDEESLAHLITAEMHEHIHALLCSELTADHEQHIEVTVAELDFIPTIPREDGAE